MNLFTHTQMTSRKRKRGAEQAMIETIINEVGKEEAFDKYIEALKDSKTKKHTRKWLKIFESTPFYNDKPIEEIEEHQQTARQFKKNQDYWCYEHVGQFQNQYPVVSFRTERNKSSKLQLHQTALLDRNDPKDFRNLQASHLCHNKKCIRKEHLVAEKGSVNQHRNYCPCYMFVNGYLVHICKHEPKCLFPGPNHQPPQ